jgi:integrase
MTEVTRITCQLPSPYNVAFAIGAYAGLRTGEVLGLDWSNIDLVNRKIRVSQQVTGNKLKLYPKDGDNRTTIIPDALLPILEQYHIATKGVGLLFKPSSSRGGALVRGGSEARYMSPTTLNEALSKVVSESITWYQATRHTFASQWILNGGSLEILQKLMGHSSILVTQRYAHLKLDNFSPADLSRFAA